ncbi:MAG: hypothetical protein V4712_17620 [Pseudomonadota bacterium]
MDVFGIGVEDINGVINTAKNGGGLIKDAFGLAKTIRDAVRSPTEPVDRLQITALVGELSQKLADAQIAQLELVNLLMETEAALKAAKQKQDEAGRYELTPLPMGGFVLALKQGDPKGEPFHYLCQPCADEGKKRILQPMGRSTYALECPTCKQVVRLRDSGGGRREMTGSYGFDPFGGA